MSTTFRLYGVEFSPARLDTKHRISGSKTGFQIGCEIGYNHKHEQLTSQSIYRHLGVDYRSTAVFEFEDEVKFGVSEASDFIRDVVAGYFHSKSQMQLAVEAVTKLSVCLTYMGAKSLGVDITPMYEEDLDSVEEDDTLAAVFDGNDFLVEDADGNGVSALETFKKYSSKITDGKLLIGENADVEFRIYRGMEYNESRCRGIHSFLTKFCESLYPLIQQNMAIEQENMKLARIRQQIEAVSKTDKWMTETADSFLPNVYLED